MKIAVILPSLRNAGPCRVAYDIISALYHKNSLIELIDVYYFDSIVELDFPCKTYQIKFSDKIDFDKYDIIHSHMYRPDKYIFMNRKAIRAKTVTTIHNDIGKNLLYDYGIVVSIVFRWVWLLFIRNHDKIVFLSEYMRRLYRSYISEKKLLYIYNGRELHKVEDVNIIHREIIQDLKNRRFKIIGANALLTKIKGLHLIISVLPELKDYIFIIIGEGKWKAKLMRQARKLGVIDRCLFFGYKMNAIAYLPFYDVYAMPSISEGFPLALIEAAFTKKSCVCSDIPLFREIFSDDEVTFFELGNRNSLKAAIEEAYEKRTEKGAMASLRAKREYTAPVMASRYLELYKSLVNEGA